ncbi:T9SS type A sorting domain-containing protein [Ekhidna sp.]|uniref:T9SS type A sorting domain-containing protein n=1 Tax=Ekhidna sp. TaxID=2608089 RepID=UPI003517A30A
MRRLKLISILFLSAFGVMHLIDSRSTSDWKDYVQSHPYNNKGISLHQLEALKKQDRPDLAMQQNFLMTVDPRTKTIPIDRLVKVFEDQKNNRMAIAHAAIEGVSWVEKGPNNVGGRTRALMWDPNDPNDEKLWAAGVAGGIWFNNNVTDENSSWQNVNDFMANLAVTSLVYDPTNTQVFYAGTGEGYFNGGSVRGAGIFKSTDGGANWSQLSSTSNSTFNYVQRVIVTTSGTVLASTRDGGVQRSTDGGASWSTVLNSSSTGASSSRANDLDLATNGDIYATLGIFSVGSIHRSTDDGASWEPITPSGSPERIEIAVAPSASSSTGSTVIYALASNFNDEVEWFKKSTNGGSTWSNLTIPQYRSQDCNLSGTDFTRGQVWYDLTIAVKPTDENVVLAGGINVVKTSDGGVSTAEVSYWTGSCDSYVHADIHNIVFRPNHPNEAVIGSDGGVSYSVNVGSSSDPSFSDRNKDYNVTQFYAVAAQNSVDVGYFIAGAQDNGTQQFTEGNGMSTVAINGGDGAFCFIDQDDNNFQISSYVYNVYDRHNSNGSWTGNLSNNQNQGRFINPADYDNEQNILYSAGDENQLMRISGITTTPNSQETLPVSLDGGKISAIRANANTNNRIYVGTGSGSIYLIDNANTTPSVTNITSNISAAGYISSIDVGSSDDELIVTFSNYGIASVWYTDDGGSTWIDKDNDGSLPDMPIRWALFNPNDTREVLLATELGVWSTSNITNANPGWEQSSADLANVRCDMLQYRSSDNLVIVATHGRGVFTSTVFDGLATPSDLIITQNSLGITLNWTDNSDAEDSYVIERSLGDESAYSIIATLPANSVSFVDEDFETNQTHYYRVYGSSLTEADSRTIDGNILSIPEVPILGTTTDESSTQFTINWSVVDDAPQVLLDVSENDDFSTYLPNLEGRILTGSSFTVDNRPSGTYYFRLAAANSAGSSDYSNVGTITLDPLSISQKDLIVYPNPSKNEVFIKGVDQNSKIEVVNLSGQQMRVNSSREKNGLRINISQFPTGTYFLCIINESSEFNRKIIKK